MSEIHNLQNTLSKLSAAEAAQRLLGCELIRTIDNKTIRVKIVETEAYDQTDAASHSYKGRTPRTDIMFGPAGHLYVYFIYGMHYCCNIVIGEEGSGAAVLIRAVEPLEGIETMQEYRSVKGVELSNGPAKVCQALAITMPMNGHDLSQPPLELRSMPRLDTRSIVTTKRIGISKAHDMMWRFYIKSNKYVSHNKKTK
jgi:DNA-3-methyladenine glycosylase